MSLGISLICINTYVFFQNLLKIVVKKSQEYNIFQLENLYAVISQCIYQHRRDYDKTALIQVNSSV